MNDKRAQVIIPSDLDVLPEPHEVETAWILAKHFNCTVEFLRRINGYKIKTPDIKMMGVLWEMKSPTGKSKTTIDAIIRKASKQSKYIVIDGQRTILSDHEIEKSLRFELQKRREIKKIILIKKSKIIVEIS